MNLRNILFLLAFTSLFFDVQAQDTIVFKSGERTLGIVKEISDLEILYKDFNFPDGPDYKVRKSSLSRVALKNGQVKQFSKEKPLTVYPRNIIAYHIFDMVYPEFTISYEHILNSGKLGLKVPFSLGYNYSDGNNGPRNYNSIWYTGVGLNVYLMGQRMASYFIGPEIHVGEGVEYYGYYDEDYYGYGQHFNVQKRFYYTRFIINNGIAFCPIPEFRLAAVLGLGFRYYNIDSEYDYSEDGMKSTAYFTFSMGYRF
ncbi:MAG: hypothetical protein R2764_03485 [Bacteroidales bacterium]